MRNPVFILLSILCSFVSFISISQEAEKTPLDHDLQPATPTAWSFSQYGQVPVSLATGAANIEVPLYSVSSKKISIPIKLGYDATGVRANEEATWVGLKWNLLVGGVITRVVRGMPDEQDKGYSSVNYVPSGNQVDVVKDFSFISNVIENRRDVQPDEFSFNFPNGAGKFVVQNGEIITYPYSNLKIEWVNNDYFVITDNAYNKYYFKAKEHTHVRVELREQSYTSAWYLTRIENGFDAEDYVDFSYKQDHHTRVWENLSESFTVNGSIISPSWGKPSRTQHSAVKKLSKISTPYEEVFFNSGDEQRYDAPGSFQLNSISVYKKEKNGNLKSEKFKEFFFSYGWSHSTSISNPIKKLRMMLNGVYEYIDTKQVGHKFAYSDAHLLPIKTTKAIDHWGYYNGASDTQSLVSQFEVETVTGVIVKGGNRESNSITMQYGTLKSIQWPTGGTTELELEANNVKGKNSSTYNYSSESINIANNCEGNCQENQLIKIDSKIQDVPIDLLLTSYSDGSEGLIDKYSVFIEIKEGERTLYQGTHVLNESNYFDYDNYRISIGRVAAQTDLSVHIRTTKIGSSAHLKATLSYPNEKTNLNSLYTVGGLRVKRITQKDGLSGKDIVQEYDYSDPEDINAPSSYLSAGWPIYSSRNVSFGWVTSTGGWNSVACSKKEDLTSYTHSSSSPLQVGDPVYYRVVTEYVGTKENNLGKIEHRFSSQRYNETGARGSGLRYPQTSGAKEISTKIYHKNGRLLKESIQEYSDGNLSDNKNRRVKGLSIVERIPGFLSNGACIAEIFRSELDASLELKEYYIESKSPRLLKTIEVQYDEYETSNKTTTEYFYRNSAFHGTPQKTITTFNDGSQQEITTKFAGELQAISDEFSLQHIYEDEHLLTARKEHMDRLRNECYTITSNVSNKWIRWDNYHSHWIMETYNDEKLKIEQQYGNYPQYADEKSNALKNALLDIIKEAKRQLSAKIYQDLTHYGIHQMSLGNTFYNVGDFDDSGSRGKFADKLTKAVLEDLPLYREEQRRKVSNCLSYISVDPIESLLNGNASSPISETRQHIYDRYVIEKDGLATYYFGGECEQFGKLLSIENWTAPVETITSIKKIGSNQWKIIDANYYKYIEIGEDSRSWHRQPDGSRQQLDDVQQIVLGEFEKLELTEPLNKEDFEECSLTLSGSDPVIDRFRSSTLYRSQGEIKYQENGNISSITKKDGITKSVLWTADQRRVSAFVAGATVKQNYNGNDFSYIGFETGENESNNPDEDFWKMRTQSWDKNITTSETAHTGNYSRRQNDKWGISKKLTPSDQYGKFVVSAWLKAPPSFKKYAIMIVDIRDAVTGERLGDEWHPKYFGSTNNKWKYRELVIDLAKVRERNNFTGELVINIHFYNSGAQEHGDYFYADDIMIRPMGAQINTYTYNDWGGVTSVSNANGIPTYYEYDDNSRLELVKDFDGNILQSMNYVYNSDEHLGSSAVVSYPHAWDGVSQNAVTDFSGLNQISTTKVRIPNVTSLEQIKSLTKEQKSTVTQYTDGLGRPVQTIAEQASSNEKDMVQFVKYDEFGRTPHTFLPYEADQSGNEGSFRSNSVKELAEFYFPNTNKDYATDYYPFASQKFDESPLNMVVEQGNVGDKLRLGGGKTTEQGYYFTNASNVLHYYLKNNTLHKGIVSSDEIVTVQWIRIPNADRKVLSETVSNNKGQQLVTRTWLYNKQTVETHYVYDDFGRLKYVIQPEGIGKETVANDQEITEDFRNKWTFQYNYDNRGRLVSKKIPGADWVKMKYDYKDRLIGVQDGNLRDNQQFQYTKYDRYNRPVMTGVARSYASGNFPSIYSSHKEERRTPYGYTNNLGYPAQADIEEVLTTTFYDDYSFLEDDRSKSPTTDFVTHSKFNPISFTNEHEYIEKYYTHKHIDYQGKKEWISGEITGTLTKVLGENKYLATSNWFDDYGRTIQAITENSTGGVDKTSTWFDFEGKVLKSIQESQFKKQGSTESHKITEQFQYDHTGRMKKHFHTVDDQEKVELVYMKYNTKGELKEKNLHRIAGRHHYLQGIDYKYNILGWLTDINNVDLSNTNQNWEEADVFGFSIRYFDDFKTPNTTSYYNGNIAEIVWNSTAPTQENKQKAYNFQYDELSRLKKADYYTSDGGWFNSDDNGNYSVSNLSYDKNGNILSLIRNGVMSELNHGMIDDLSYLYDANQLLSVTDQVRNSADSKDFEDYSARSNQDYSYDKNGNMIADANKNITSIEYNILNLPKSVNFGDGRQVKYLYDAAGIKLKKQVIGGSNATTHYVGNFQYENNVLDFISTSEGRILNGTQYQYFLQDHLGNNRITFQDNGSGQAEVVQQNDYYPFGGTFNLFVDGEENLHQYNGKEMQEELGLLDYGARMYDANIGRFHTQDRFSEKYYDMNPYQYGANNPIKYIDVNGDSVDISHLLRKDRESAMKMISDLERVTGLKLSIVNGVLKYDTKDAKITKKDASKSAKIYLMGVLDRKDHRVMVKSSTTRSTGNVKNSDWMFFNKSQTESIIGGLELTPLDTRTQGWGMTFLHELLHTKSNGGLLTQKPRLMEMLKQEMLLISLTFIEKNWMLLKMMKGNLGGKESIM